MGAKEPSWAATELRDLITERLARCICKVGTIQCTSQAVMTTATGIDIKILDTEPGT